MKESQYVNDQLNAADMIEKENGVLKSAIALVKAAGYSVTHAEDKPKTHVLTDVKDATKEAATGIGHFVRGLGRVTLERTQKIGNSVKDSVNDLAVKGQ